MTKLASQVVSALFLTYLASTAEGSFESMVQVAQPLLVRSGETGVWICSVPYLGHSINPRDRGSAIGLTVARNRVSCDTRCENRNLAAVAGITFAVETTPDPYSSVPLTALQDTLRIVVAIGEAEEPLNSSVETILQATLWCGLLNARQVWPDVKFVEYLVEDRSLGHLSGIYSIEGMESSAETRWGRDSVERLDACRRRER